MTTHAPAAAAQAQHHTIQVPGIGDITFNVQPFYLVISHEFHTTGTFDSEGRLLSLFRNGANYLRGLDNTMLLKRRASGGQPKQRTLLSPEQTRQVIEETRAWVQQIHAQVSQHHTPEAQNVLPWLVRILAWDAERLAAERTTFSTLYKPLGILPPDQYRAVVLQATEGCTWNRCTFCSFYHNRPFVIQSPAAFRDHVRRVKAFLGDAIGLRTSVFLADANALIIPQQRLLELLQIVHEELPIATENPANPGVVLDGIYSFLDIFGADRKQHDDYRALREYHVRRIYIGLETGDPHLFGLLNKAGSPHACLEAVQTIKGAGINVGVILLAGAGGQQLAAQHMEHSLAVLSQMGLDAGDIVYLSPLVVSGSDEYTTVMQQQGIEPLSQDEIMRQVDMFKAALKTWPAPRPRVTLYHIHEFLY